MTVGLLLVAALLLSLARKPCEVFFFMFGSDGLDRTNPMWSSTQRIWRISPAPGPKELGRLERLGAIDRHVAEWQDLHSIIYSSDDL